ncbi:MAG: NUDIX domain-containing protein, partial [Acidimicrobiales bacterium]
YSPAEVVQKEVREETGIECDVVRPIAVLDGLRRGFTRIPLVSLVFHCRATGGSLAAHPLECLDVGFFAEDRLPEPVAGADLWADHAFRALRGEDVDVMFDAPRIPPWRRPSH